MSLSELGASRMQEQQVSVFILTFNRSATCQQSFPFFLNSPPVYNIVLKHANIPCN